MYFWHDSHSANANVSEPDGRSSVKLRGIHRGGRQRAGWGVAYADGYQTRKSLKLTRRQRHKETHTNTHRRRSWGRLGRGSKGTEERRETGAAGGAENKRSRLISEMGPKATMRTS